MDLTPTSTLSRDTARHRRDEPEPVTARLRTALGEPLHRTGNALVMNSGLTAVIGVAFWAVAARSYHKDDLGLNSTAISAMMMLAGFAQLNLMSAMVRFLPTAGRGTWRLVGSAYLISAVCAMIAATVYLLGLHLWAPALATLLLTWPMSGWFVLSTALWCVFVLQDSVLTGVGRPSGVPIENTVHSVAKLALVAGLAAVSPRHGVFLSWTVGVLFAAVPVNVFLLLRAIPRHILAADPDDAPPPVRDLARFVLGDYVGSACWIAATALPAQFVLSEVGPAGAATFSIAWVVGFTLYAVPTAIGQGLVVQASRRPAELAASRRRAFGHCYLLLTPAVLVVLVGAPLILRLFGASYATHGAWELRLLALSALPNVVLALTVSELRVRRRVLSIIWVLSAACVVLLSLSYVLLKAWGLSGVGAAWLLGQLLLAAGALLFRDRLMGPDGIVPQTDTAPQGPTTGPIPVTDLTGQSGAAAASAVPTEPRGSKA
jgi:O-antigen/teichoic acid export membrane protein